MSDQEKLTHVVRLLNWLEGQKRLRKIQVKNNEYFMPASTSSGMLAFGVENQKLYMMSCAGTGSEHVLFVPWTGIYASENKDVIRLKTQAMHIPAIKKIRIKESYIPTITLNLEVNHDVIQLLRHQKTLNTGMFAFKEGELITQILNQTFPIHYENVEKNYAIN